MLNAFKLFAVAAALACGSAAAKQVVVAAFGDSLSAGYGLRSEEGFAPQLEKTLQGAGLDARVINAGVSGETSEDARLRVDWMLQDKPDIVVVEFGANDMFRGLPVSLIADNLSFVIARIKKSGARVLLAGMQAPANHPPAYRLRFAKMYEALAKRHDVPLMPFFLKGVALDPRLNLDDGIHPNAQGVRVVAKNVAPYVLALAKGL